MVKMKESGIEWIDEIPEDWQIKRIKYILFELKNKANYLREEPLSITQDKGIIKSSEAKVANPSLSYEGYIEVRKNDIVFNKYKAHSGVFFVSKYDGMCTFNYSVYRAYKNIFPKYYEYLFHTDGSIGDFKKNLHGVGESISPLYTKDLFALKTLCPSYEIQKRIADFLDSKCEKIDSLRNDIQKQIETLEQYKKSVITEAVTKGINPDVQMKDSGIEWIGEIPEHWNIEKGKYVLIYLEKPTKPTDGVITCFRDGEVTLRSKRREDGFTISEKEIGYQGIDIGDLVVHGMDGFAGSIGISDSRGKASPVLNVLNSKQNKRFLMYYLRSMAYGNVFLALATGIRVRSCDLRWNKLAELPYPIPPMEEQNQIVKYIDSILDKTNKIISTKKQQLETLEEYKKSLIFEYVTGKKEC